MAKKRDQKPQTTSTPQATTDAGVDTQEAAPAAPVDPVVTEPASDAPPEESEPEARVSNPPEDAAGGHVKPVDEQQRGYVVTIEEVLAAGFSPAQAAAIVAGRQAEFDGPKEAKPFVGYRVHSAMSKGFWAAGRQFKVGKPADLHVDDLNDAQIAELEAANPAHLVVEKLGF